MIEVLKYIFSSFWIYIGVLILISVILNGISIILKTIISVIGAIITTRQEVRAKRKFEELMNDKLRQAHEESRAK